MKRAVIDLGTNTALLLVTEDTPSGFTALHDEERIVGLGRGLEREGAILPDAVERAAEALAEYARRVRDQGITAVRAVGTAVFRAAANGEAVRADLTRRSGLPLRIISGEEEARMVYLATVRAFSGIRDKTVIDIGGGSTEFIEGSGASILRLLSLPVGAVRLTERFLHRFPAQAHEIRALRQFLARELEEKLVGFGSRPGEVLIGTAGTFTTAAALAQSLRIYDPKKITGFKLKRAVAEEWLLRLSGMTLDEQREVPGLKPERAGVVLGGIALILSIYEYFDTQEITVSDAGLRYGVLYDWLEEEAGKREKGKRKTEENQ